MNAPLDTRSLIERQRLLEPPLQVAQIGGLEFTLTEIYRLLPGKRITGKANLAGENQPVIAKIFLGNDAKKKCLLEVSGLRLLQAAGVSAPTVIADAEIVGGGQALFTTFFERSQTLADRLGRELCFISKTDEEPNRLQIASWIFRIFEQLAELHQHNLIHLDPHPGNWLFSQDRLFVLDGDAIQQEGDSKAHHQNLALVWAQFPPQLDDLLEMALETYLRVYSKSDPLDSLLLKRQVLKARKRRCQDLIEKSTRDCTLFSVQKNFMLFTACARNDAERLSSLLSNPDQFFLADSGSQLLKSGNTCTVVRAKLEGQSIIIKRYNIKSLGHWLGRFWRPSRAWHSWVSAHLLRFWGIPTPQPLALVEERWGPLRRRAWFISEEASGPSLTQLLAVPKPGEPAGVNAPPELSGAAQQDLVALTQAMARYQITHGDLKGSNLIWSLQTQPNNDSLAITPGQHWNLIDLDSVRQHTSRSSFRAAFHRDCIRLLQNFEQSAELHNWAERELPKL